MTLGWNTAARGLLLFVLAAGCDDTTEPEERTIVLGSVFDNQTNTRLLFYDDGLVQVGQPVIVEPDGTFGPLSFPAGVFFGAGFAAGFTTGEFLRFEVRSSQDTLPPLTFDLDPITVPLAVGNRWTYDEIQFLPQPDTLTRVVEITSQQSAPGVPAVFAVEERVTDPGTGGEGTTITYFLAQDPAGIRKSADATIDAGDELLLRLPATLQTSWSTVDFATGEPLQKRLTGFSCEEDGCRERNDVTIAQEPAGTFLGVAELHTAGGRVVVTTFADVGIVDLFEQESSTDQLARQLRLRSAQLVSGT